MTGENVNKFKLFRRAVRSLISKPIFRILPDKLFLRITYWAELNSRLNFRNPETFTEKIQWLKINNRKPEYTTYVDKYRVRNYIEDILGIEYLIPLIQSCDSADEINWDSLPEKFVIKCNHGSGSNIVCSNKNNLNIEKSKRELNEWMNRNWYWFGREWPYKNVKKKIIIEEYLQDNEQPIPKDYKFWVFNGEVKFINVHFEKDNQTYINIYNNDWELQKFGMVFPNDQSRIEKKPKNFSKMKMFAEKIAENIPFIRVDFYEVNGQIYFGELTFYPTSGFIKFYPNHDEVDEIYGKMLDLKLESFD